MASLESCGLRGIQQLAVSESVPLANCRSREDAASGVVAFAGGKEVSLDSMAVRS